MTALLDMHLAAELADYLGSDPECRGDHVLRQWIVLARHAAPGYLDTLAEAREVWAELGDD